jgi:hypothetical protein
MTDRRARQDRPRSKSGQQQAAASPERQRPLARQAQRSRKVQRKSAQGRIVRLAYEVAATTARPECNAGRWLGAGQLSRGRQCVQGANKQ